MKHADEVMDKKLINKMVKKSAMSSKNKDMKTMKKMKNK